MGKFIIEVEKVKIKQNDRRLLITSNKEPKLQLLKAAKRKKILTEFTS